jgi:hypothetical protein
VESVVVRGALVAVAVLLLAWLALSLRAVELSADGAAVLKRARVGEGLGRAHGISHAEAQRGLDLLRRAQRFNADSQPLLDETSLLIVMGKPREAMTVARRVLADEPENVIAWTLLIVSSRRVGDTTTATQAALRVRALNPLFARTLTRPPTGGS